MPKHLRRVDTPAKLLDRILGTPQLARAVPQLPPEILHRLIQHCGLEDSGELLALVTPAQLTRVFDLDLWRAAAPGLDERFDAERFGRWLEVMVEAGVPGAAATLASMDEALLAAAFASHGRVFDDAAVAPYVTLDGELSQGASFAEGVRCEIGGYVVLAKRTDFWDAIATILTALADTHGAVFDRVMRGCCRVSSSRPEIDALDDRLAANDQAMFDVALDRETRSDAQGYVTPAQARAFLQTSRQIDLREPDIPPRDAITRAYFRDFEDAAEPALDVESPSPLPNVDAESVRQASADAVTVMVELLRDAGVIARDAHALLEAPQETTPERLARIRTQLELTRDHDPGAYSTRCAELVYLANVIAAGATIQSRPVRPEEASDAVMAVCNLGLEMWPAHWQTEARPEEFLIRHDLVRVFQVGWTVLHEDVCMYVADHLVSALASLHAIDSHIHDGIVALRTKLVRCARSGAPWEARDALDVIAILDTPAWAALVGLVDQLPTMHAALGATLTGATHRIDPSAFDFISEAAHVQQVRDFMRLLPDRLR